MKDNDNASSEGVKDQSTSTEEIRGCNSDLRTGGEGQAATGHETDNIDAL